MPEIQDVHLVVLCHGLWGSSSNLRYLCRSLIKNHPGSYLAPKSDASTHVLTDKEAERIKKAEAKRKKLEAKGQKLSDEFTWEEELLKPTDLTNGQKPEIQLVLLNTRSNEERTYDGIDWSAERVRLEIDAEVTRLRANHCHVRMFSIIGYSLGGLVSRYVVGLLHSRHFFTLVPDSQIPSGLDEATTKRLRQPPEPVQFSTLATPHLGMLPPTSGFRKFAAYVGARVLSRTGDQLFLRDSGWEHIEDGASEGTDKDKRPRGLIEAMTMPDSLFIAALKRFRRVVVYSNGVNDPTVPFRTGAFFPCDPFLVEGLHVEIEPDYPGLIQSYSFPQGKVPKESLWTKVREAQLPWFLNPKRNPFPFPVNYIMVGFFPLILPVLLTTLYFRFRIESGHSKERIRELRRLWREERQLELQLEQEGGANGQQGTLLAKAGRRMSDRLGMSSSTATSGTATPVPPSTSTESTPITSQPASRDESIKQKRSSRSWVPFASSSSPAESSPDQRQRDAEDREGEQSRIQALLRRVEEQTRDAAEVGDGTVESNRTRAKHGDATVSVAKSSDASAPSVANDRYPLVPPEHEAGQPKYFPIQKEFIKALETSLGDKLERRFSYFPRVINSHAIIIVRVPTSDLSRMGVGVVKHFVDTFSYQ
ncbi:hypothetical protein OC846_000453 [Tilletia horrida]|uniref:DUF676 domain-containing protein n=1 Tax=Tilletia horrida TaxID=155126 RepID=A0AAN6JWZ6_9BASI|nr:hypothetical protein OC846_000453 [Tilletia horrida]KAK0569569.1 hypothetical protein OC861_000838 [Tilletia horrida]